jgi:hypothetical protein
MGLKNMRGKKSTLAPVTNLAKFKRYTAQNGTLILQNYMLSFFFKTWGPAI